MLKAGEPFLVGMRLDAMLMGSLLLLASGCLTAKHNLTSGPLLPDSGGGLKPTDMMTEFRWSPGSSPTGDFALRIKASFERLGGCTVTEGVRVLAKQFGPQFVSVIEYGAGQVRTDVAEFGSLFHFHVSGVIDTRTQDAPNGGFVLESKRQLSSIEGSLILTLAVQSAANEGPSSWNYKEGPAGVPAYLNFRCDSEFRLKEYMTGSTVTVFSQKTMAEGNGGHVEGVASLSAGDQLDRNELSPTVQVMSGAFSDHGSMTVKYPGGQVDWSFSLVTPSLFHKLEAGPGDYSIKLSALGIGQDDLLWGAVLGLAPGTNS